MYKYICAIAIAAVSLCTALEMRPIAAATNVRIEPPMGARHTDGFPIADSLSRVAITFTFPDSFFLPTTAILEAILTIKITPDLSASTAPKVYYCIPLISLLSVGTGWSSIDESLLNSYSEVGFYDPDSGTVFFEIGRILQSAATGDVAFHGIVIVPAEGSPACRVSAVPRAIDLKASYAIGKREPTR
jgi:hypothetical protein